MAEHMSYNNILNEYYKILRDIIILNNSIWNDMLLHCKILKIQVKWIGNFTLKKALNCVFLVL